MQGTLSQGHTGSSGWVLSEGEISERGFGRNKSDHSSHHTEWPNLDSTLLSAADGHPL